MTDSAWLSCHATTVVFQRDLPQAARSKNTVIVEYLNPRTEERDTVGGCDLHDAISRAQTRILCSPVMVREPAIVLAGKLLGPIDGLEKLN